MPSGTILRSPLISKIDSFEDTHSSSGILALPYMVGMATGPVFKESLPFLIHPWTVQQALELRSASVKIVHVHE